MTDFAFKAALFVVWPVIAIVLLIATAMMLLAAWAFVPFMEVDRSGDGIKLRARRDA